MLVLLGGDPSVLGTRRAFVEYLRDHGIRSTSKSRPKQPPRQLTSDCDRHNCRQATPQAPTPYKDGREYRSLVHRRRTQEWPGTGIKHSRYAVACVYRNGWHAPRASRTPAAGSSPRSRFDIFGCPEKGVDQKERGQMLSQFVRCDRATLGIQLSCVGRIPQTSREVVGVSYGAGGRW